MGGKLRRKAAVSGLYGGRRRRQEIADELRTEVTMGGKPRRRAAGWRLPATMVVTCAATFGVAVTCADVAFANPALTPAASESDRDGSRGAGGR